MSKGFLTPDALYRHLADGIDDDSKAVLSTMKHTRIEAAYRNRKFIVYEMRDRAASKLATVCVLDFLCDDDDGCSTQLEWMERPGEILTVGYEPTQLWDFPIFVHLPVHQKVRWSAREDDVSNCSLSFMMVVRTKSRYHLRERNIIYMEAHRTFHEEFFSKEQA